MNGCCWNSRPAQSGAYSYPPTRKLLSYYLLLDNGEQTMLTPAEFEQRFGWQNDLSKVALPGM